VEPGTVELTGGVMMTTLGAGLVVLLTFAGGGVMGRMLFVAVEGKVRTVMLKTIKEGLGP
jgi:voltage-gated potassium channel Kch